jgi:peptidoglycan hydrolase-like protein with peptidoglycan-binding domain
VPDVVVSPFLESQRRSRARRFAAHRARRRRWSLKTAIGVLLACLSLSAGGALASSHHVHMKRSLVVKVQRALGIPADGIYGRQTRRAVRRFQRRHRLHVDGIAGPQTLAALGITTAHSRSLDDTAPSTDPQAELAKIAQCESGGDPTAVSPDGTYRGKYQFTRATWEMLGGTGDPAQAPEALQDQLATKLLAERGTAPWPNCA